MVRQLAVVGITKVATVYLSNPFGIGGLASVEKSAAVHQISLVVRVPLAVDGTQFDTVVAEVANSWPQAIIVISNQQLESALGERSRGIVISQVVPSPWNRSIAVSREFQALAAAMGLGEYSFSQMEGFSSAKFLVEAVKRAGSKPTREGLVQALESMSRVDLGGYAVDMSPSQHSSGRYVDLVIVGRDGRFTR